METDTQINAETDLKQLLVKKQGCFKELSTEEIEVLASLLVKKEYEPGDSVVRLGDPVDGFYLLASGSAEVFGPDHQFLAKLQAENFTAIGLNEQGFYSLSGLRTATVIASSKLVTYYIRLPLFHGFALYYSHVNQVMRAQTQQFIRS